MVPGVFRVVFTLQFLSLCAFAGFSSARLDWWLCILATSAIAVFFIAANLIYAFVFPAERLSMQRAYLLPPW
jgi:hypothetical protein